MQRLNMHEFRSFNPVALLQIQWKRPCLCVTMRKCVRILINVCNSICNRDSIHADMHVCMCAREICFAFFLLLLKCTMYSTYIDRWIFTVFSRIDSHFMHTYCLYMIGKSQTIRILLFFHFLLCILTISVSVSSYLPSSLRRAYWLATLSVLHSPAFSPFT